MNPVVWGQATLMHRHRRHRLLAGASMTASELACLADDARIALLESSRAYLPIERSLSDKNREEIA